MENFALIFVAIFLGYVMGRMGAFSGEAPLVLNKFILYISAPALVLLQIPKLTLSLEVLIPVFLAWSVMSISAVAIFFFSKFFKFSKEVTGSLMLVAVLGNSSYLGIPIVSAYFGDGALGYVLMYDQLGTFIALSTYGTFVSIYYASAKEIHMRLLLLKIISFPPFLALLAALFLMGAVFPPIVESVLVSLSSTIIPLALVAVGLGLRFKLPKEEILPFSVALVVKLIFAPIIAIALCALFGWNSLAANVSIMEASMAPMITAAAVASMAGLAPRLSSAIVGYGIILSLGTTWVVHYLIT